MTWSVSAALFLAMIVLAVIPGPGIMVVVSRTLSNGLRAGVITTFGIVSGDFVYVTLALGGLSALAQSYAKLFALVQYIGAGYLVFLGMMLFRAQSMMSPQKNTVVSGRSSHYLAGLLVTLSNPKAVLFYVSFFPAFVPLSSLTFKDIIVLYVITAVAVGGVMLAYAFLVDKSLTFLQNQRVSSLVTKGSGVMLLACGVYLIAKIHGY